MIRRGALDKFNVHQNESSPRGIQSGLTAGAIKM